MKVRYITIPAILLVVMVFAHAMGQDTRMYGYAHRFWRIPDLTDEQREKIEEIQTETQKTTTPLQSKLNTLSAELEELLIAESPDRNAIDIKIEEIAELRTALHKKRIDAHLKIRVLLTEEQRVHFDAMTSHRWGRRGMMRDRFSSRFDGPMNPRMHRHRRFDQGYDERTPEF
jgi:Spy/CpxP family protein refolding chaperone